MKCKIYRKEVSENNWPSDKLWEGHKRRKEKNEKEGKGFGYCLINPHATMHIKTLTARYGKDGAECLIKQEGKNPRKLNPREFARFMGFPDCFRLNVSDTQAYKQLGNSVIVPIFKFIAQELYNCIEFKS